MPCVRVFIDSCDHSCTRHRERRPHPPPRIGPRNLFDMELGDDNLLNGKRYKLSATLIAINVTEKYALYNFLSTFSGTHYVTPRALTGQIAFHF